MEKTLKSGTTTVGIVCKNGIVLAADKRATAGNLVVNKNAKKIYEITENLALTTSGGVSDIQMIIKIITAELKLRSLRTKRKPNVKESANLLSNIVYSNIRKISAIPGISHFVLGGYDPSGFHLYDIFPDGSLSDCDDYIASGSGSVFAYGVLETLFEENMDVEKGTELAVKAVSAALRRDTATGEGIDVVTITEKGVSRIASENI